MEESSSTAGRLEETLSSHILAFTSNAYIPLSLQRSIPLKGPPEHQRCIDAAEAE